MLRIAEWDFEKQVNLEVFLNGTELHAGDGGREYPCSIEAVNIAIDGTETALVPTCMSSVIGHWITAVQDAFPHDLRNSKEWKGLLPRAAGTGQNEERRRMRIVKTWLWTRVIPACLDEAKRVGVDVEWEQIIHKPSPDMAAYAHGSIRTIMVSNYRNGRLNYDQSAEVSDRWVSLNNLADVAWGMVKLAGGTFDSDFMEKRDGYARIAGMVGAHASSVLCDDWGPLNPCGVLAEMIEIPGS